MKLDTGDLAPALRELERRLVDCKGGPLGQRIEAARHDLAALFARIHQLEALQGREYALQILVRADSRLDQAEEISDEARLTWASHDLLQASAWLEGASAEPMHW